MKKYSQDMNRPSVNSKSNVKKKKNSLKIFVKDLMSRKPKSLNKLWSWNQNQHRKKWRLNIWNKNYPKWKVIVYNTKIIQKLKRKEKSI